MTILDEIIDEMIEECNKGSCNDCPYVYAICNRIIPMPRTLRREEVIEMLLSEQDGK